MLGRHHFCRNSQHSFWILCGFCDFNQNFGHATYILNQWWQASTGLPSVATFPVLNDILLYRSNQWSSTQGQEDDIQLFLLSFIHLPCVLGSPDQCQTLFCPVEISWQIRQKMSLLSGALSVPVGHTITGWQMLCRGLKCADVVSGGAALVWAIDPLSALLPQRNLSPFPQLNVISCFHEPTTFSLASIMLCFLFYLSILSTISFTEPILIKTQLCTRHCIRHQWYRGE